jgi:hypothetical protein
VTGFANLDRIPRKKILYPIDVNIRLPDNLFADPEGNEIVDFVYVVKLNLIYSVTALGKLNLWTNIIQYD